MREPSELNDTLALNASCRWGLVSRSRRPPEFGEEVNDLGERELERRAGRRSRPDEFVEVEFRCRESAVIRDLRSIRRCAHLSADNVGDGQSCRVIP